MPLQFRRHQHFFHIPVAHVILYGIVKDFWKLWLRAKKDVLSCGDDFILPNNVRAEITKRAPFVLLTELFKKPYTDILKYDDSHFNMYMHIIIIVCVLTHTHDSVYCIGAALVSWLVRAVALSWQE
jgi:hypothetical protein